MKASLIQMNSQENKRDNLAQAKRLIEQAVAEDGPDLIVLPEVYTHLSENLAAKRADAEELPKSANEPGGESYEMLKALAAQHRVVIHGGSMLEKDGDQYFNTTVVFDRDGTEIARYRKIHLFDVVTPDGKAYRESATVGRGDRVVTYEIDGKTIGCSICYDIRFPELYQALAAKGADVIMVPAAFTTQTGKDHWEVLLRARAIETETYVLAAGQYGPYAGGNRTSYGHSMAVNPWGHVIANAPDKVGFVTATLDFDYQKDVRERLPVQQHKVL